MKHLLPAEQDVKSMLEMIFGDGLTVNTLQADATMSYIAVYVDGEDKPGATISCDAAFAAGAGAALSMLPPDVAKEAALADELPQTMRDNLHEVMNICTRLIIGESTPHLRLQALCCRGETDAEYAIRDASSSSSFTVEIPQYGGGTIAFLVT